MNKIYKQLIVLVLCSFSTIQWSKADTEIFRTSQGDITRSGVVGVSFLKIPIGAQAVAMGGAYTAIANDLTSMFWNPAGLASIEGYQANISYSQWFGGFSHNFASGVVSLGNYRVGLGLISFGANDIPFTTIEDPTGSGRTYSVSDVCLVASFAGKITNEFSFGANFKYINSAFSSVSSNGIAFDIGTKYESDWKGLRLGFVLSNLGPAQNYAGQDLNQVKSLVNGLSAAPVDYALISSQYQLPLTFRAGMGVDMLSVVNNTDNTPQDSDHKWTLAADFFTMADSKEQGAIGTEYVWNNLLALRAGYQIGHDTFGFSGGIGLNYTSGLFDGKIDYAISPANAQIGLINRISIGIALK